MTHETILIIDDHALFRSGILAMLSTAFHDVSVLDCASLDEALEEVAAEPAVVLLDIQLSKSDGLEGMSLIQRRWPAARIVVVSAHDLPVTVGAALAQGACAFISKCLSGNFPLGEDSLFGTAPMLVSQEDRAKTSTR